jgi:predicted AAA+ superfamily ATPase
MLEDPQSFLAGLDNRTVVLDEIHRLPNPSELLKIAADHFPALKVLATGSSTLGASAKFRDTLAGQKAELRLTPMIFADLEDFQNTELSHRFHFGGLPPFFLAREWGRSSRMPLA